MSNTIHKFYLLALMIFISASSLFGQASLSGRVSDERGSLPGVTVLIAGTTFGGITDNGGSFRIQNLPEGEFKLILSFIGYESVEIGVNLEGGKTLDLGEIKMTESIDELGEIVVVGTILPSEMRAFNIQKNANNIQNVLAADGIGKLPDRNAAEAVQRVPGVTIERDQGEGRFAIVRGTPIEWSSNLVNGDRLPSADGFGGTRQVALDIIPSELIEYAVITKALTPDMEGDAIGGAIDFQTRTAPADKVMSLSLAGGYNAQIQSGAFNGSLIYGDRIGEKFGFLISAANWNRPWASDNYELEYNFDLPGNQGFSINNQQIRDYEGNRNTTGFNLAAQYDLSSKSFLYVRGLYSTFEDTEFVYQHDFNFPEGPDETENLGSAQVWVRNAGYFTKLYGGELGGEHPISDRLTMDWKASTYDVSFTAGRGNTNLPSSDAGIQIGQFQQFGTFGNVSSDNYVYWDYDSPNNVGGSGQAFQPSFDATLDPNQMILTLAGVFGIETEERDRVGQVNFNYSANSKLDLKFGAKYRNKNRYSLSRQQFFLPVGLFDPRVPIPIYSDFDLAPYDTKGGLIQELDSPYESLLLDDMMTENAFNNMISGIFNDTDSYIPVDGGPAELNTFDGTENVAAGYLMGTFDVNPQITLTGGVRLEQTNINIIGYELALDESLNRFEVNPSYTSVLPSLHLKYTVNEKANIRGAYTRSLARPNFSDINPTRTLNSVGNITFISEGNAELLPTYSNNFDLLGEYYFDNVGILSGGVFYKDVSNVIFDNVSQVTTSDGVVRTTKPENLEEAWLLGFELAFTKRFTSLPGFWSGFGVNGNYTYTKSEVIIPTFNENGDEILTTETLLNQPEHIYNFSIFYEKGGFSARLAANYKGEYLAEYRIEAGPDHYRFYDKNLTVDLSSSYAISDKWRIFAELNNITNEPLRYYHGSSERPEQIEFYSIRGQAGIRFSLY
ncbi:MAG: TonB-dependent receptor [Algoriphagus marincola HL-49]|uniref:TonB-dependent receptor n=1 Tax=Algoriphagus marincola HL-49 TaxID=1305737 RepID=A0A0N8KF89_9BACT|nr:MAG: TonB-dependent receptor [Algoriphagus marincola HL-49]